MPEEVVFVVFTGILGGTIVLTQFIRTMGRYLERKASQRTEPADAAGLRAEVSQLQSSIDTLRQQVGEVEERVDFAERLITRERQHERLHPGGGGSA